MITKDFLGLVGGVLGGLYALGYLVAAGHARVLGLPVRSTDPAALLGAAWEFLVRGSVVFVLRGFEALTPSRMLVVVAMLLFTLASVAIPKFRNASLSAASRTSLAIRVAASVAAVVAVTSVQVWHIAANVVPTSAVTSLLFNKARSPFVGASQSYFDKRWYGVQADILGDGTRSYSVNLGRRYVLHVGVTMFTAFLAWLLWRVTPKATRAFAVVPLALSGFLVIYTPLLYGVLLKSYQYPVVNLVSAEGYGDNPSLAAEMKVALTHSRFLVDTSSNELYLFDTNTQELHVVARSSVAMVKVVAEDFIFRRMEE